MNRFQKERLIEEIDLLMKAHEIICSQIQLLSSDELYQKLAECQSIAIQIGTRIELLEGQAVPSIKMLEEYCELVYQYSNSDENMIQSNKINEDLDHMLLRVKSSIDKDIKTKYEVIFLPYKASMWDSLESIWIAANKDPRCISRVIPIPYYDKNPDGSFGAIHNEGNELPDYVKTTSYTEYILEENRPDIIYFHNPYDNYNHVTSVHPSFYSSELKKYTDLLVYVPYFVTATDVPEHFRETMGVFIADKVIVQSDIIKEKYKQTYIDILGKEQKEKEALGQPTNRQFWDYLNQKADEKFLALGSPKIDKVIHNMQHKPEMPKEWSDIIRKRTNRQANEDISDIKLILYNTSVTDLLTYKEKALNKIKTVIDVFRGRTDAILLWRPHPLNVTTMKSMAPQLLEEYLYLVEEYCQEEYGIYDTSPDVHRAIALADAYYGDAHSSLIEMFGVTGKPIMKQNMDITDYQSEKERYSIGFEDFVEDGEYIWFADCNRNGLYRMNLETKRTEYVGNFPGEQEDGKRLFFSCTMVESKLFFAPFEAETGMIYNIKTGEFRSVKATEDSIAKMVGPQKYIGAVAYKNNIYMMPCLYPAIGCYTVCENEMHYEVSWLSELAQISNMKEGTFGRRYMVSHERYLLMPFSNANAVLEFDMELEQAKVYKVGVEGNSYSAICYDGRFYWLAPRHEGAIIRWDKENQETIEYNNFPGGYLGGNYNFIDIVYCAGFVWLYPLSSNMVIKLNPDNGEMECVAEFQMYLDASPIKNKKFHWIRTNGEKIISCSVYENTILVFDPVNHTLDKIHAIYPYEIKAELIARKQSNIMKNKEGNQCYFTYSESDNIMLDDFIMFFKGHDQWDYNRRKAYSKLFSVNNGTSGENILSINLEYLEGTLNSIYD